LKKLDLGQTITILANIGVIAGIIFLGIEMGQSQRIALSDIYINLAAVQIEADNAIADNADIWSKGNAGEELTSAEFSIFAGQVRNIGDVAYYTIQVDLQMGLNEAASIDVVEFALYLHRNPGAFKVWLDREKELSTYRGLLNSDQTFSEDWMNQVLAAIERFEDHEER
jgi:hypothetical protein